VPLAAVFSTTMATMLSSAAAATIRSMTQLCQHSLLCTKVATPTWEVNILKGITTRSMAS
jgi:hypothetical protein